MDKNLFNKSSNFFKKEGFYVILFVCLCIVATVAAITSRNNKKVENPPVVQNETQAQGNTNSGPLQVAEEPKTEVNNALQVKSTQNAQISVPKDGAAAAAAVSKTTDTKFIKPVEGTLARAYSDIPVLWDSTSTATSKTYRPNFGIDIKADLGKPVMAVLDGKVETVTEGQDGVEVTINHQNGLKTVYANLDPKVNVSVGQTVKKGAQIGKVGKTTLRAAYEKYGDHLHFAVISGKDFIDPAKYIKY